MMDWKNLFKPDSWFALPFDSTDATTVNARPFLERVLYTNLGILPLEGGERPQTDGQRIILSSSKNDFQDLKEVKEMHENRNLTLYISDLLHEMLHVLKCSFELDARPFLSTFNNPGLAHTIMNMTDDGRIEYDPYEFRPEDINILRESNKYYTWKRGENFPEKPGARFMELYTSLHISKGMPSEFKRPELKPLEQETLTMKLKDDRLRRQGMHTVGDLLNKYVELGEETFGQSMASVFAVLPDMYKYFVWAFPEEEKDFDKNNKNYHSVDAPSGGPKMPGSGQGQKKDGNQDQDGSRSGGQSRDQDGNQDGNQDGDQDQNGGGSGNQDGPKQQAFTGMRGDVHDFSIGEDVGDSLSDLVKDYKRPEKPKEIIQGKSKKGNDTGQNERSDEKRIDVICYNHDKQKYLDIHSLIMKPYGHEDWGKYHELISDKGMIRRLSAYLRMMKPNALQRVTGTNDPEEFNMETLLEVLADPKLAPHTPIYDSYKIMRRDHLAAFLLDCSGSTSMNMGNGQSVIDLEKYTAAMVSLAYQSIGDEVLIYGYETGSNGTMLHKLKNMGELGALQGGGMTPTSIAIRGCAADMKRYKRKKKTLIVLTDGAPNLGGSDPYLDTAMAFQEAEIQGIRTVYMDITPGKSERFADITRHCTFAEWLPDATTLPGVIYNYVRKHG